MKIRIGDVEAEVDDRFVLPPTRKPCSVPVVLTAPLRADFSAEVTIGPEGMRILQEVPAVVTIHAEGRSPRRIVDAQVEVVDGRTLRIRGNLEPLS